MWQMNIVTIQQSFSDDLAKLPFMSFVMYESTYFLVLKYDSYKILEPL